MTNAELMQNGDCDETNCTTFISNILVMSKQMRILVEQMLELARADNIQHNILFSSIDFSQLVLQVLDILLDNAKKYSHEKGATWVTLQNKAESIAY